MGRNGQGDGDKGCRSYIKSIGHRLLFEFQVLNVPRYMYVGSGGAFRSVSSKLLLYHPHEQCVVMGGNGYLSSIELQGYRYAAMHLPITR